MTDDMNDLEKVLSDAGVGWLLQTDRDERLAAIASDLRSVQAELSKLPAPTSARVGALRLSDPDMKPFIQCFAVPMTNRIRAMVYCLLDGAELVELQFAYKRKSSVHLHAVIELADGHKEEFDSHDLWDAEVLRHFGLMKMGNRPLIHGYYAFGGSA